MATDLEKAWKIVSGHRSFIGPDDTMPEDIAKAIVEGILDAKRVLNWQLS